MTEWDKTVEEIFRAQRRNVLNPIVRALILILCVLYAPIFILIDKILKRRRML